MAREKGFKGVAATRGDVGLAMARHYQPDAITLDIELPEMDGWTVLDRLKHDPATRHIPVHIISVTEEAQRGLRLGRDGLPAEAGRARGARRSAFALDPRVRRPQGQEPAGRRGRRRRAPEHRRADRQRRRRDDGGRAPARRRWQALEQQPFDCMVLDLGLARHDRLRAARADEGQPAAGADSGHRLHRQGADQEAGDRAAAAGRDDHRQGREVAGPAARRDGAVPAPGREQPAGREAARCSSSCTSTIRRWPARRC